MRTALLSRIQRRIIAFNTLIGRGVAWLLAVLMVVMCVDVILRKLFNLTAIWSQELEWHLFAAVFLLGAAWAFAEDRHVRVDLFYAKFSPRDRALVNMVGGICFLIPWSALLGYVSLGYAWESWTMREGSPNPGGLPGLYVIKFCISLGMWMLMFQGIASVLGAYVQWRQPEVSDP